MKVLFLSNSIGGIVNFRYELIQYLVSRGDDVYVSSQIEQDATPDWLTPLKVHFIETPVSQRGTNPFGDIKLIHFYIQLLRKINPDIVLSYTIKPNIYGSVACRIVGVPIIANVTGLGTAMETPGLLQKITIALFKWGFKQTNHVYFQNQSSIDFFLKNNIKMSSYELVAGSGVNLQKFAYEEYPEEDVINFLYVGRILPAKGIQQIIDAANYFKNKSANVRFNIVGIKDDPYYSEIILKLHDEGTIVFYGKQKDIRPFVAMSHCLVHPSYYPEGMSNVLLESSAMGRPAITTDKAGCREIIDNEVTGYIVKQNNSGDFIEKIERFIELSHNEKKQMGKNARHKVEREFDRVKVVEIYVTRIDELKKI